MAIVFTRPERQLSRYAPLAEGFKLLNITYIHFMLERKYKIARLTQKNTEGLSYWHKYEVFQLWCCRYVGTALASRLNQFLLMPRLCNDKRYALKILCSVCVERTAASAYQE